MVKRQPADAMRSLYDFGGQLESCDRLYFDAAPLQSSLLSKLQGTHPVVMQPVTKEIDCDVVHFCKVSVSVTSQCAREEEALLTFATMMCEASLTNALVTLLSNYIQ